MDKIKLNQQTADAIERFIMGPDGWGRERDWDALIKYLNSLVREEEIAIFNDHLIPVTEEQLKDGGFISETDTKITNRVLAAFENDWWYSLKGGHNHEPTIRDMRNWLKEQS